MKIIGRRTIENIIIKAYGLFFLVSPDKVRRILSKIVLGVLILFLAALVAAIIATIIMN